MAKTKSRFTDELRKLVANSEKTPYRIGKDTGIDQATLSRFLNGRQFLSEGALNALADYFGWEVTAKRKGK